MRDFIGEFLRRIEEEDDRAVAMAVKAQPTPKPKPKKELCRWCGTVLFDGWCLNDDCFGRSGLKGGK